jgi:exodeoxyribonuclease VII large subunit
MTQHWRSVFQQLQNDVSSAAFSAVHEANRTQERTIHKLIHQVERTVQYEKNHLERVLDDVDMNANRLIKDERKFTLEHMVDNVRVFSSNQVERDRVVLENLNDLLDVLNPNKMLEAGYTISTIEEIDVDKYEGDISGKIMKTLSSKRLITSKISEVKKIK